MLLRGSARTVNEIAQRLDLTDNAIRAHLLSLERDGLVEQRGAVKGFRKPHFAYGLTAEARHLFPKPYAFILNKLIGVLKRTLPGSSVIKTLRGVGRDIAGENVSHSSADIDERLAEVLKTLEMLGGSASVVKNNGTINIQSESCPFNEVVAKHPETCQVAQSLIEEIVGKPVKEICNREGIPKCCFAVDLSK